jgi:dTDP-glucose 4,6-dehydratase
MADVRPFHPRRLLVTGGAGFIGSHFVVATLASDGSHGGALERLVVLDALTYAGRRDNLAEAAGDARLTFVHGDVCDGELVERLFAEHAFDAVVHLAAESHVDRSIADLVPFVRTNVVGTCVLLDAARRAWSSAAGAAEVRRFVHVSSDEVYGALGPTGRFDESSAYAPRSPYAASKAGADHFVRAMHATYGLPVVVTHSANNYGPRQLPEKLVARAIARAIAGQPIPLYGAGEQVREWLHVADHVDGLARALSLGRSGETYDFGGTDAFPNRVVVDRIADAVDAVMGRPAGTSRLLVTTVPDRPGHDFRYALSSAKAARELAWEPRTRFPEGLAETVAWYVRENAENRGWTRDSPYS